MSSRVRFSRNIAIVICGLFPMGNTLHKLHNLEFVFMALCLFVFCGVMVSSIAKSAIRIDENHYRYVKNATITAVTKNFYCKSLEF